MNTLPAIRCLGLLLTALLVVPAAAQDLSTIADFWYRLQGLGGADLDVDELAAGDHELLIIDYSKNGLESGEFSAGEIDAIRDAGDNDTLVIAYVSIGEASDFRWYYDEVEQFWPHVLADVNPAFPESRKVRYWSNDWKQFLIGDDVPNDLGDSYVKRVVDAGFDGIYLDIIDAFEHFGPWGNNERPSAASDMIDLVEQIAEYARVDLGHADFLVIPQNGAGIIDIDQFAHTGDPAATAAAELDRYVDVIDALGLEDVFHLGKLDENNKPKQDKFRNAHLAQFLDAGVPMFATEYLSAFRPNPKKLKFPQVVQQLQDKAASFGDDNGVPGASFPIITQVRELDRPYFDPLDVPNQLYATALAVGQPDTSKTKKGTAADALSKPAAVASDGTSLVVADPGNHRVLVFDDLPEEAGSAADTALGQPDFLSKQKGKGGLGGLNAPMGVAFNGDQLFVADTKNNRVLVWDGLPTLSGQAADFVMGQVDDQNTSPGTSTIRMRGPTGLFATDEMLWVCDTKNNRVLGYDLPIELSSQTADVIIGQDNDTKKKQGHDADELKRPMGVAVSADGVLAIADTGNHRVLIFDAEPAGFGPTANRVVGQSDFGDKKKATSDVGFNTPTDVAFLADGTLVVTDAKNNRVCLFDVLEADTPMLDVIGQVGLFDKQKGKGALGLAFPSSVAVVPGDELFVVDAKHNRVLRLEPADN